MNKKLGEVTEDNKILRKEIASCKPVNTYAEVTEQGNSDSAVHRKDQPKVPPFAPTLVPPFPPPLQMSIVTKRIDVLEQEAISCFVLLQGPRIEKLITDSSSQNSDTREVSTGATVSSIKQSTLNFISSLTGKDSSLYNINNVSVYGKNRKSLQIKCSTRENRNEFIIDVKRKRPAEVFASEFLTKNRSELLYKLRLLKRRFSPQKISAVYTRNGIIMYKLPDNERSFVVNDIAGVNKLEERILNNM